MHYEDREEYETHINMGAVVYAGIDYEKILRQAEAEDGPTLTHGEMADGAGVIAARRFGAAQLMDPRPHLAGSIKETFQAYPGIGMVLPAMGYGQQQMQDLAETINSTQCDLVLLAAPVDLTRLIDINKPSIRIKYGY